MEITNPNSIWNNYDVKALPLNASELSAKTENNIVIREFYYDGYATVDGRVRVFIRFYENPEADGKMLLYMSDTNEPLDNAAVRAFLKRGYSIAALDYLGNSEDEARFTLYPHSISLCNSRGMTSFPAPVDTACSRWYIWTCMARKAIVLIKKLYGDVKIFALGKGLGGSTVFKLATFDDGLTACATLLNVLPDVNGKGNPIINYRAALDNRVYAPMTTVPMFVSLCSNDEDGSLDRMSELATETASMECFRIIERSFADGIKTAYDQIDRFFVSHINGKPGYPAISVEVENSNGNLYYNIKIKNADEKPFDGEVELFSAFCTENPANRNWTNVKPVKISSSEYIANIEVLRVESPVYVYVSITDKNGNVVSSPLLTVTPKALGIKPHATVFQKLLYDGSMGKDVWLSPRGGEVEIKSGAYGIDGVTSNNNVLITFKPGDKLFSTDENSILQIMASGKCREITVEVTSGDSKFKCDISLPDATEWHKFLLNHNDFKNENGSLADWSNVIRMKLSASDEFLISSILWV